jgi:hypothetical protein
MGCNARKTNNKQHYSLTWWINEYHAVKKKEICFSISLARKYEIQYTEKVNEV